MKEIAIALGVGLVGLYLNTQLEKKLVQEGFPPEVAGFIAKPTVNLVTNYISKELSK